MSEAMGKHPKAFDRLYVGMIKAGEAGGVLDTILDRLAMFLEKSLRLKKKVIGALIYPVVVTVVAVGILAFIMTWVILHVQSNKPGQVKGLSNGRSERQVPRALVRKPVGGSRACEPIPAA